MDFQNGMDIIKISLKVLARKYHHGMSYLWKTNLNRIYINQSFANVTSQFFIHFFVVKM